jgi:hypothetical protein
MKISEITATVPLRHISVAGWRGYGHDTEGIRRGYGGDVVKVRTISGLNMLKFCNMLVV